MRSPPTLPPRPPKKFGMCTRAQFQHREFFCRNNKGNVIFYREGAPENWGDQVLFLRSKGGSKDFFKLKRGRSLIFFKQIKYFLKHFRTQMEFLLILQKRCMLF